MIKQGTKIRIPAGIPFFTINKSGMLADYKPTEVIKTVVFDYQAGLELCFESGYARVADLIAAGVIREKGGELFVASDQC